MKFAFMVDQPVKLKNTKIEGYVINRTGCSNFIKYLVRHYCNDADGNTVEEWYNEKDLTTVY